MDRTTGNREKRNGRLVALALTATAGLGLLPGTPARAATTEATIANFKFSPNPLPVAVGATVRWTNTDETSHTVTADDGSFDSGPINPNGTFTQPFGQAETITYHCDIHPSMHGTLQIGGGPPTTGTTAAPTTTTTAAPTTTTTAAPVTTTTAPPATTATTLAPTGSTAPRSTTTKPTPTTRVTAAPAPTSPPGAATPAGATAPAPSAAAGPTGSASSGVSPDTGPVPAASADSAPPDEAASGLTTEPAHHDGASRTGLAAIAAGLALLGGGGWWALRRRQSV